MNTCSLSGNLTRDPEIFAPNNSEWTVINYSIANNDDSRKNEQGEWENVAHFFDCTYWTKKPQLWLQKLRKGVLVVGEYQAMQERWEKDGQTRSRVKFSIRRGTFPIVMEKRESSGDYEQATPAPASDFEDDKIPF